MTMTITAKRLAIALAVSLALNLFLVGFVTARALWGRGAFGERGHHGKLIGPRGAARDGDDVSQAMRRVFDRRKDGLRQQRKSLRAARGAVSAAFSAEPFDAAALERAFSELRAQTAESQRLMHESLIEIAPELSPQQRARLARRALGRGDGPGKRPH